LNIVTRFTQPISGKRLPVWLDASGYNLGASANVHPLVKWIVPVLLLGALGCGTSESSVVGTYTGEAMEQKSAGNIANNVFRGLASSMSLDIKADKTFHMVATVIPVDGTWVLSGDTVTLTPERVLGVGGSDVPAANSKVMKFRVKDGALEPLEVNAENRFRFIRKKE
jgi:hypothetical protein